MIIYKLLQEFLLPSVFVLFFLILGFLLVNRDRSKKLLILGIVFYYFFSITPISDLFLSPFENRYRQIQDGEMGKSTKIVLLLGGLETDVLRASEVLRIYYQKTRIENQETKIIVSGRDPLTLTNNEVDSVQGFLEDRGVAPEDIILEDNSRNTAESARCVKEMVGDSPFILVTSAYHMPRSMEAFQKIGANPISAPTDFKVKKDYAVLDFFPDSRNLKKTDLAFHEYFGIIFYRFLKY